MPPSELDVRASLFNLLSTRRDIDNLTLELLGRYNVERLTSNPMPDFADRLDFSLACQLEFIFDLQRTHLQSRTPFSNLYSPSLTERLPYLLSFQTAKGAFGCLRQLADNFIARFDGDQDSETSSRRSVFVRALISGTRMLCLHPAVTPGEMIRPFTGNVFSFWEQTLTQTCDMALKKVPRRHPGLQLPRMGRKMYPIDDSRLMNVVNECTVDFTNDSAYKYWTLYDISCSVVAAYIQHRAASEDVSEEALFEGLVSEDTASGEDSSEAARLLGILADKIAGNVVREAHRVRVFPGGERLVVLLVDIIEVLNPILAVHPSSPCQAGYEGLLHHTRYCDHKSIYHSQDTHKALALYNLQKILRQRELVLRDSNEELPTLLSSIERTCSDIANVYIGPSSPHVSYFEHGSRHTESYEHINPASPLSSSEDGRWLTETLKLYAANCESTHIIADGPRIAVILRDAEEQQSAWENGSLYLPHGTACPFCPNDARPFNHLREISPLNQVLELATQKSQQLDDLRRHRETSFMEGMAGGSHRTQFGRHSSGEIGLVINSRLMHSPSPPQSPNHRPTSSSSDQSPEHAGFEEGSESAPGGSSHWNFKKMISVKKKAPETTPDNPVRATLRSPRGEGELNVTLSADCECLITWTTKNIRLYDISVQRETQEPKVFSYPMKDPVTVLASRSYFAIVQKGPNSDEASSHPGAFKSREPIKCLALSPDDTHLALGLSNGVVQVLRLNRQTGIIETKLPLRLSAHALSPVVSLSFSADTNQMAAAVREGTKVSAYTLSRPFDLKHGLYVDRSIGELQDDDQGVSSVICCPERSLLCLTYWTRSGVPLLIDCAARESQRLNKSTAIGTRIQQGAFSKSGKFLVLINSAGGIFKITIDDIQHIKIDVIGKSRSVSRVAGESQLLDMKISDDSETLKVVWTKDNNVNIANYRL